MSRIIRWVRGCIGLLAFAGICVVMNGCGQLQSREALQVSGSPINGEKIFTDNCSSCHNFRQNGIGPHLGGLTTLVSDAWIKNFIRNPKQVIEGGDERAAMLFEKYKTVMPSFSHYTEEEVNDLLAFLHTKKAPPGRALVDPNALKDPIPEPIPMSDLVVDLELLTIIPASSQEGQLTRICKLDYRPDTKSLYIVDLRGKLYELRDNKPEIYLDIAKERPDFIHKPGLATGFGSFAFHPEFATNGLLYTTHAEHDSAGIADFAYDDSIKVMLQWVLTEWKTDKPGSLRFSGKGRELLRINMVHSFHGVQEIGFNPNAVKGQADYGLLYIGIGDGSSVEFGYPFLAHSTKRIWGTIIRIDPAGRDSKNKKYGIPPSNPFANSKDPDTVREIYAFGFRNPHRFSWTRSGQMLSSNIGHHNVESLNLIMPGNDYGWPEREGSFVMDLAKGMNNVYTPVDNDGITDPIAQYDHDEGNAISGGYEYYGTSIPELRGKYVFGDIVKGRLFYISLADIKIGTQAKIMEWKVALDGQIRTLTELCAADKVDLRFGRDHRGEVYILTKPDGKVYRLKARSNAARPVNK
ncbi:MAG TPA: PQQ-dependent sugar dehydrogenase [Chryseosolibacter sp.]|nr:PQQ-dependent sugar dehydrogenase [Chryseosolibacter sp.]